MAKCATTVIVKMHLKLYVRITRMQKTKYSDKQKSSIALEAIRGQINYRVFFLFFP